MEVLAVANEMPGWLMNLIGILGAIVGLGLVIFLHELGHFAVAKWCNVNVERFSIGFGPIILGWKWGETEYALSAIPFGGYVKMLGQDDADPSQMTSEEIAADPRSYVSKNVWQRMAIISAGVTMNVLTAILFNAAAFGIGSESIPPVIGEVRPGLPAWVAGVRRGDTITHFNGREVTNFRDLALSIAVSNGPIELRGERRTGDKFTAVVEPDLSSTRPQIGIAPALGLTIFVDPAGKLPAAEPGTVADKATPPFKPGDTIIKLGDTEIESYSQFQNGLAEQRGAETTITVRRGGEGQPGEETIQVGPNYFHTLGLRFDTGPITGIQANSPAKEAGLQLGDKLVMVNGRSIGTEVDPLRLPDELAKLHGQEVELTFKRANATGDSEVKTVKLTPEDRPGWLELPKYEGDPLSIPAIGIAYHVVPHVIQVEPDSPAAKAGIQPVKPIQILKVELVLPEGAPKDGLDDPALAISLYDEKDPKKANNWGFAFWSMQQYPLRNVQLTIREFDQKAPRMVSLTPVQDSTWPLPNLFLNLRVLVQEEKAHSIGQAFSMSWIHSRNTVLNIYLTLRSLITQRLSYKELHGPLGIAQAAYDSAKMGMVPLLLFLGFLSLNLAVLNFLPIPVLDGGHMVFLAWEAITRRRPSEKVMIGATYVGMAFLLGLMMLVLYLDFFEHGLGFK